MSPESPVPTPPLRATSEQPAAAAAGATLSPGAVVRRAREQSGLSLDDLAGQLKLARATLEAVEADDFATLSEPVYVRGYYRRVAKALAIPEAELLAAYERRVEPRQPQMPTKLLLGQNPELTRGPLGGDRGGLLRYALPLAIAAGLGGAAWFFTQPPSGFGAASAPVAVPVPAPVPLTLPAEPATVPAESTAPAAEASSTTPSATIEPAAPVSAAPAVGAPAAATPAATTPAPPASAAPAATPSSSSGLPAASAPAPVAAATTAPAVTAAAAPAVAAGAESLQIDFKSSSWIRVEDAERRVLLSGVVQAGDRQVLNGKPPYALFVGNAPAVVVQYAGRTVDATAYTRANATARFSVP